MKKFINLLVILIFITIDSAFSQSDYKEVSKNVIKIDADRIGKFSQGYAVISKGGSSAIIDNAGKYIVPYNRYWFYDQYRHGMISCSDLTKKKYGYLDLHQNLAVPLIFKSYAFFDSDGYASNAKKIDETNPLHFAYSTSKHGILYPLKRYYKNKFINYKSNATGYAFHEGLVGFSIEPTRYESLYGFANRQGNIVIEPQYISIGHFSEGLAPVSSKNDRGELKWGFIDKTGAVKIPFLFSKEPEGFSEGLCLVEPFSKEKFEFAYIDKSGNIKIQFSSKLDTVFDSKSSGSELFFKELESADAYDILTPTTHFNIEYDQMRHPFQSGIAFWQVKISNSYHPAYIDKQGNLTLIKDILKNHGIIPREPLKIHPEVIEGDILFICDSKYGMFNVADGTLTLKPVFSALSHFDPISQLAYAVMQFQDGSTVKGYIDRSGNFKIIKEERSGM